jgi:hypothetical protein
MYPLCGRREPLEGRINMSAIERAMEVEKASRFTVGEEQDSSLNAGEWLALEQEVDRDGYVLARRILHSDNINQYIASGDGSFWY